MTPLPVRPVGEDLTEVTQRATALARKYVELLERGETDFTNASAGAKASPGQAAQH
jgi:hypothetical protein